MRSCVPGTRSWRSVLRPAVAAILIGLSACSSQSGPRSGVLLTVTEKDYRILPALGTVAAGLVSFDVHNRGPSTHEFVVFETTQPAGRLPLGADGLTVDEESTSLHPIGEVSEIDIGQSRILVLRLPAGRYVLVCNLEGHYLGGMYSVVTVD